MHLRGILLSLALSFAMVSGWAGAAFATTNYGDLFGPNVHFLDINETSQFGDPEPLFGAPSLVGGGNEIQFFPTTFTAAAGGGGFDQTGSLLNLTLMGATNSDIITDVELAEFGDFIFAGAGFTAATSVTVTISGTLTVLEDTSGAISPVEITFSGSGDFVPVFDPSGGSYSAPDYGSGSFSWDGLLEIDVASFVADATKAELQLNNFLFAFSEPGTSATIQKKDAGLTITVIPEPTTGLLVVVGLVALGIRSRRQDA